MYFISSELKLIYDADCSNKMLSNYFFKHIVTNLFRYAVVGKIDKMRERNKKCLLNYQLYPYSRFHHTFSKQSCTDEINVKKKVYLFLSRCQANF